MVGVLVLAGWEPVEARLGPAVEVADQGVLAFGGRAPAGRTVRSWSSSTGSRPGRWHSCPLWTRRGCGIGVDQTVVEPQRRVLGALVAVEDQLLGGRSRERWAGLGAVSIRAVVVRGSALAPHVHAVTAQLGPAPGESRGGAAASSLTDRISMICSIRTTSRSSRRDGPVFDGSGTAGATSTAVRPGRRCSAMRAAGQAWRAARQSAGRGIGGRQVCRAQGGVLRRRRGWAPRIAATRCSRLHPGHRAGRRELHAARDRRYLPASCPEVRRAARQSAGRGVADRWCLRWTGKALRRRRDRPGSPGGGPA